MQTPQINVCLAPSFANGTVESMLVSVTLSGYQASEGQALCGVMESTVGIPFCPVEGCVPFFDDQGELQVMKRDDPQTESFVKASSFIAGRDTSGDIRYAYRVLPRVLPEGYTSSPYFDFRSEPGGINGAGLTFLILPNQDTQAPYDVTLRWDLANMPSGSRGVWSLGTGDVKKTSKVQELLFSYYAAGLLHAEEEGEFGLYWFGAAPFDMAEVALRVRKLFSYMSGFFGDREACYRVFARHDPFEKSGGGTAAARSFMFGYSDKTFLTVDAMQNLLAHEMVHNWPHMDDEPAGLATWYNEGCAEYYSVVLPYRAGICTLEEMLSQVSARAAKFYANPMRSLSNAELAALYWSDRRTQRVPYGRGFFYLANTDAKILRATGGAHCLDDAVMEILKRRKEGLKPGPNDWLSILKDITGLDLDAEYRAMAAGELLKPDPDAFGGAFAPTKQNVPLEDGSGEAEGYVFTMKPGVDG